MLVSDKFKALRPKPPLLPFSSRPASGLSADLSQHHPEPRIGDIDHFVCDA
jgi:hypothetical protein